MRVSAKTDIGRSRPENQDNYRSGVLPSGAFWGIVCDGMGGGHNGKLAGILAADSMEDNLYTALAANPEPEEIKGIMLNSIEMANVEVFARATEEGQVMGTTVVCAVVREGHLHLAHVGDSRAYLYEGRELRQLTRDHSMVQELVDQGIITQEQAIHHPEKNVITRAIGVEENLRADYTEMDLPGDSLLLLCTDGLTNMVEDDRLAELIGETDFYDLASGLVSEALAAGGNDNITVLLMQAEEVLEDD